MKIMLAREAENMDTLLKPVRFGVLARITTLLAACVSLVIAPGARAAVDLGINGVGYSSTVIPPSGMSITYLQDIVSFYNTGSPTSVTIGSSTYPFTKFQGSSTPPPNLSSPTTLNSEITAFTGQGSPSATINLGSGGFDYLIGQWDGPNGVDAVYYVHGLSGVISLGNKDPIFGPGTGYGLSGFWLGGGNNLPPNPNQNVVSVPEPLFGLASALMAFPISGWILLRRK
jgi:hypothetical protein